MAEHTAHETAGTSGEPASLRFVTRHVSEPERAAVTAVLGSVLEQESAMLGQAPGRGASAWQRSQRALRTPIEPGQGRWSRPAL
ncbi:acyl-CoA carboxylase epsilon subunit-like protein [Microterricola gilva]|uniref:Acyl-CoA carboxylase epsilon subunit-like protein n=1 Tax=Microterricola gilva TaxID=393267 RepID=A0A4Q8AIN5_9MICO|nr:acyl-CoA carboxylase subunit epsilon [Microterricola gilva]RZU64330.1 acyl-CoA carboxylase epsilon subunit-like protein [Microterricola gilva]